MIVKVCGMRDEANVLAVSGLDISMMGFIFYPGSKRYVSGLAPKTREGIARVGVFVNSSEDEMVRIAKDNQLDYVQLHGSETPAMCSSLMASGLSVIKAISVSGKEDIAISDRYQGCVNYILFDTKTTDYGGSGRQFDWSSLDEYSGSIGFILSGGIDEDSADSINSISHPQFCGVDLNSKFEESIAVKDVNRLGNFIKQLRR